MAVGWRWWGALLECSWLSWPPQRGAKVLGLNVGAVQPSEADLRAGKPMVLAGPAASVTRLEVRGDALRLESEEMLKQEDGSAHQIPASAHPLWILTIWSGPGLADFWPSSEG